MTLNYFILDSSTLLYHLAMLNLAVSLIVFLKKYEGMIDITVANRKIGHVIGFIKPLDSKWTSPDNPKFFNSSKRL